MEIEGLPGSWVKAVVTDKQPFGKGRIGGGLAEQKQWLYVDFTVKVPNGETKTFHVVLEQDRDN